MGFLFTCEVHWGMSEKGVNMCRIGNQNSHVCCRFAHIYFEFSPNLQLRCFETKDRFFARIASTYFKVNFLGDVTKSS